MDWFKFYGRDWLTDTKIIGLSASDRICFITLLCLASASDEQGTIKNCTEKSVIKLSHLSDDGPLDSEYGPSDKDQATGFMQRLIDNEMITDDGYHNVTVTNFLKRQDKSLTGYERLKRHRERKKNTELSLKNKGNIKIDNEMITDDNDMITQMITLDKIREDKIREDKNITTVAVISKKESYGEFEKVRITKEEHSKLIGKVGEKNTELLIEELDTYIASKGKKYSNHYATLLNWARRKVQERNDKISNRSKSVSVIN